MLYRRGYYCNSYMVSHILWRHDIWLHIGGTNEPEKALQPKQGV